MLVSRAFTAGLVALALSASAHAQTAADAAIPRYDHIFVILEENKDYAQIVEGTAAPNIARLAKTYGNATQFYAEVHPSEANYVALLGGDTFGIHDDDAFYCKAGSTEPFCYDAAKPGYVDHTVHTPQLGDQIEAVGLTWKGYYEDLPAPGSEAVIAGLGGKPAATPFGAYYASKHSGFLNFASVQNDPKRAEKIVGFDQFDADLAANRLPNFAVIVPNQCNEMHGLFGPGIPADCLGNNTKGLIERGDAVIGVIVGKLMRSDAWKGRGNTAIIVTFDEGFGKSQEGCCGVTPGAVSNYGGGRIPTLIITNHGPRGVADDTPYSHYSRLRTMEDAFGVHEHLGHAAETDKGVVPMGRLFAVKKGFFERLFGG